MSELGRKKAISAHPLEAQIHFDACAPFVTLLGALHTFLLVLGAREVVPHFFQIFGQFRPSRNFGESLKSG